MLLRELFELGHINIAEGPLSWEDAILEGVKPLVADGSVEPEYGKFLVENVKKYGPYIVLVPGIAMPHAMGDAVGTNKSAISLLVVKQPVHFSDPADPETDAQLFFTLSDVDHDSHLQNMQRLMMVMSNEEVCEKLKAITDPKELVEIDALVGDE